MSVVTRLPRTPSALIRMAVDDLEALEATPGFGIDMTTFLTQMLDGTCAVCLAGASMVRRLDGMNMLTSTKKFGLVPACFPGNEEQLAALDEFRMWDIEAGCYSLGLSAPEDHYELTSAGDYKDDPAQFKADMRKLADELEERGL